MNIIHKFLINVIYYFKVVTKILSNKHDYKIQTKCIEYYVDHDKSKKTDDPFWKKELKYLTKKSTNYYTDVDADFNIPNPPECVIRMIIRVKFWYDNKSYKYITYDNNHAWPPRKRSTMIFNLPLSSAVLLDEGDKPVKDLLCKISRYAGPFSDFYNEKIEIKDMFWYEDSTYEKFPKIKIKNIVGMTKTIDVKTGYISDLHLP